MIRRDAALKILAQAAIGGLLGNTRPNTGIGMAKNSERVPIIGLTTVEL